MSQLLHEVHGQVLDPHHHDGLDEERQGGDVGHFFHLSLHDR